MTPRIEQLAIEPLRVAPAEAVLAVTARLCGPAEGLSLRGKVLGPFREGHNTIAVAYPLQPSEADGMTLTARVVIPEPNTWTPDAPFHYDGVVELVQSGLAVDRRTFTVQLTRT